MNIQTQQLFSLNVSDSQASGSAPTQRPVNPTETAVALQNVQDFSKVCRACASTTEFIVPIFSGEGLENNLADKINKHMPIKVSKTDILPQVVCYQCASQLLAWHELVKCCTQADLALRTILANTERKTDSTIRESKPTDTKSNPIIQENSQSQAYMEVKIEGNDAEGSKMMGYVEPPKTLTVEADGRRSAWCGACNKSVSVVSWRRHLRLHNGERRYSCHTCGRAFADSGNLARHVRTLHAQERPFSCTTCYKTFSRKAHLNDHIKSHSEMREFVCDVCGKGSKSSAALRMHVRTHSTRARAHTCVHCGAAFKRRAELRAHVSVHTGERAHACECGRTFRLRSQLNAHARTHHNTEQLS